MAVPAVPTEKRYVGNGVTTIYTVPFRVIQASDLAVYVGGVKRVSGYSQAGVGDPNSTVIFSTAPGVGVSISLMLEVPFERLNDYQENGDFLAATVNRDFDRIWLALQQLLRFSGRALMLGQFDTDGQGWYRAKSNGIRDLRDPEQQRDAATMGWTDRFVARMLGAVTGPINNALNIFYRYPDNSSHLVQDLSGTTGSVGIGHGTTTVGAELNDQADDIATLQADSAAHSAGIDKLRAAITKGHLSANGILAAQNPWGVRCLNIFGDSISFGANAQDIERASWVGVLKKLLNIEFGQSNIGVLNIVSQSSNADGVYKQYFEVASSQTGTWVSITAADAAHIPFGFALESSTAGSTQNLKAPLSQRYMRVWYDGAVIGEIEVVINGVVVQTITTTGTGTGYDRGEALELGTLVASNQGVVTFTLRCKSGTIRLTGLEFTNDSSGNSFRVHNFSRDGRAGRYVAQNTINIGCTGCYAFIWALSTNDITGYDAAAQAAFDLRIDWIIAAAAANRTKVVFVDWLYNQPYTHGLRASLRRGAASIPNAILIEADQIWTVAGAQFSEAERIQRALSSGVHPEEIGHRLVAETIAQRLGLSVTSKKQAIRRDPMWKALDISASGFANNSTEPGKFTGFRIGERGIEIIVNLATVPTVLTTLGTIPIADFPGFAGANFKSNPDVTGKNGLFTITSSGVVVYRPDPTVTGTPTACSLYATIPYNDPSFWF